MSEAIPQLRLQLYADHTEGGDLGGGSANTWTNEEGGQVEERSYIRYDFTTREGYTERMDDYSIEGQAIRFSYDLSQSPYAAKRQFVLGHYAYLISKSYEFTGTLPSGSADCYLTGSNRYGRKKLQRSYDASALAQSDVPFASLSEGAYHAVSRQYLYPQPAISGSGLYSERSYSAAAELLFSGVKGAYPPYLDVAAEPVVPYVTAAAPVDTFADKTEDIVLRWAMAYDSVRYADFEGVDSQTSIPGVVYGTLSQKSALVRWTEDGESIHELTVGAEGQALIPAGKISGDSFRWQVQLCSSDDVWSEASPWYEVRCDNDTLSTATALQPQKIIIDGTADNLFQWQHENESSSRPTGADLQYSLDGEEWNDLLHVDSRDCEATVPADSLPAGLLYWRVRTYNASGAAGQWSAPVQVTVLAAPAAPQLLFVGTSPLPELRWSSAEQRVAEISMDGKVCRLYQGEQSLRWSHLLESGSQTLSIRVQNEYGLWSSRTEQKVEIQNYPQENFLLSAQSLEHKVRLTWNRSFPRVQLLRDGVVFAEVSDESLSYEDWQTAAAASYQLRGITEEGYYTLSNEIMAAPLIATAAVGNEQGWITLHGRYAALPEHQSRVEQLCHLRRFSPWQLPLSQSSGQWSRVHSFVFSLRKEEGDSLKQLQALSGQRVVYKDARGDWAEGILGEVQSVHRGLYRDLSFTITEAEGGQ